MEKFNTFSDKESLVEVGLNDKEALIYLAALKTGGGTISELSKAIHTERSGIYYHIDKLINLGLLKYNISGKRRVFTPADPANLKKILSQKQKELDKIMPDLSQLFSRQTSRSITGYYQGAEDVKHFYNLVYEKMTELKAPDNLIYMLGNAFRTIAKGNKSLAGFEIPKEKIAVEVRAVMPMSQRNSKTKNAGDPYLVTRYNLPEAQIRFMSDKYKYPAAITLFNQWIAIFDYKNLMFSLTENKNIAETWRVFFEFIWGNLPKK